MQNLRWRALVPVVAALVVAVLAAGPALAQEKPGPPPKGPIAHLLRCLSIVDLTDTQKQQVRAILEAEKPVMEGLHQQLRTDAQALQAALQANPPVACTVGDAFLKVHADRAAIRAELEKIKTAVEAVLTPEQVARLNGCLQAPNDKTETGEAEAGDAEAGF